jgi:hypothetical protein
MPDLMDQPLSRERYRSGLRQIIAQPAGRRRVSQAGRYVVRDANTTVELR